MLAVLLVLSVAASAAASGTIRVAMVETARTVELRGTDIEIAELGACSRARARRASVVRATAGGGGVEIDGVARRRVPAAQRPADPPQRSRVRRHRSSSCRNGDGLAVVNELPLEDYIVGVLRAEAGDKWPLEALRAQAIVARTYAAYHRVIAAARPYHIVASTAHQQYAGRVPSTSPIWGAVRETAGQVLLWEGELFPAFYHTESGGYTEDPRTVFATRNMPALKPVRCEFSAGSPHYYWSLDVRLADLSEILRRNDVGVGNVTAIEVTERTPSLRAATVTVHGTRGHRASARQRLPAHARLRHVQVHALRGRGGRARSPTSRGAGTATAWGCASGAPRPWPSRATPRARSSSSTTRGRRRAFSRSGRRPSGMSRPRGAPRV